jgi:hypothetical protein
MPYDCPECGDGSGTCGCDRPFNFPTVYLEFKKIKHKCVKCGKHEWWNDDEIDMDVCLNCYEDMEWDEVLKHMINTKVIA